MRTQRWLGAALAGALCAGEAQAEMRGGPWTPDAEDLVMIEALVEQARTGPTATRLEALERLDTLGMRHGLDTALELIGDADEAVARESAQMLANTLAMQDRAGIAALEQRGGEVAKQVRATLEALRRASTDPRPNVRDAAAPTMAALGDRDTLWQITLATIKGEIPGTEGV